MPDNELDLLGGLDLELPEAGDGVVAAADAAHFFGPYQLIQEVGQGGVARVMRARHIHPQYADKSFAVKVLHAELSQDPKVVALFRREAFVLALLKHPNIVQTFEAGAQDDKLFIAMEYVDGRDFDNLLTRCQAAKITIPVPVLVHVFIEVLRGLSFAHELTDADDRRLALVHRDVNPANVFVAFDGRIKLGDFGVASITAGRVEKSRELAGKVGYFAPEQLAGDPVDHRADLFAMGVMLFEALCGQRLFDAADTNDALRLNRRAKVPRPAKLNPQIGPELERVVLRALERKPQDRYASGRDMLRALEALQLPTAGMRLAIAALMRRAFLQEHDAELHLVQGLSGRRGRGGALPVAVLTADPRAQGAFAELLQARGFAPTVLASPEALRQVLQRPPPPEALLVDVSTPGFSGRDVYAIVQPLARRLPVVAVSDGLDVGALAQADALRATDLVFKPLSAERVLTALRGAIHGQAVGADEGVVAVPRSVRILLVSRDVSLVTRLPEALLPSGYVVEVVGDGPQALQRAEVASFHAIVYDAFPGSAADRIFAQQFRLTPGTGMVPFIFLADDAMRAMFAGMLLDRSRILGRRASKAELLAALAQLRDDVRVGRTFVRYETDLGGEVRYGGRVFACRAVDLSRGGVMLRCEHIPPVGTEVGCSLDFGRGSGAAAVGHVIRVNLVKGELHDAALVGVQFASFAGRGEAALIAFIRSLDGARSGGLPPGF